MLLFGDMDGGGGSVSWVFTADDVGVSLGVVGVDELRGETEPSANSKNNIFINIYSYFHSKNALESHLYY